MDELSLLRRIRSDVDEPEQSALDRGRAALLERAGIEAGIEAGVGARNTRPDAAAAVAKRRHPVRWVGLGALGAGVLTVALVATNVLGFAGWRGGAEPAAADALQAAALAAVENSDPVVGPGQYLLVETDAVYGNTTLTEAGDYVSFLTINRDKLYVPADRSEDWVWARSFREPYESFSAEGEALAAKSFEEEQASLDGVPELLRAPDAQFYGSSTVPDFDALPTDPQQLLNHIYKVTVGSGQSPDGAALGWISDALRTGVTPADVRAALYEAAAGIPGVEITEQAANLEGRTGISIGRVESADNSRQDLIIDTETGALIGERRVALSEGWGFPAGTTTGFTAVRTSVVDTAPDGGTRNGRFDQEGCTDMGNGSFQC
jgi:RNA polymerase sigma-70 factor (ECF subfamily)